MRKLPKPHHISIVTHGDGTNPIVQRMVRAINGAGEEVTFFYWDRLRRPELLDQLGVLDKRVLLSGCGRRNLRVAALLPWFWLRAVAALAANRPRVVYAHAFEGAVAARIVNWLTGVPYIYHIHDNISISHRWRPAMRRLLDTLDAHLIRHARSIVLPDACRIPNFPGARDKAIILPNSTEAKFDISPVAAHTGQPLTIAALGSLEVGRGVELLVQATAGCESVRVVAAGYVREKALADQIARQPNWEYAGVLPHSEVARLYERADLIFLFYAPDLEINRLAVPIKLPEALASGRPVLMNEEVQIGGRVREWGVGYTCAYDASALRACLESIAQNRTALAECAAAAKDVFAREFAWPVHAPKVVKALQGCFEPVR